jgi:hypothetical protein
LTGKFDKQINRNFHRYYILEKMLSWVWGSSEQHDKEIETIPQDSEQQRHDEYLSIKKKYPDWLPITIHSTDLTLTKHKYLTRPNLPFKKFAQIVQNYCVITTEFGTEKLDLQTPIFFAANGMLIPGDDEMGVVYEIHKKTDGFLHIDIRQEPDDHRPAQLSENVKQVLEAPENPPPNFTELS